MGGQMSPETHATYIIDMMENASGCIAVYLARIVATIPWSTVPGDEQQVIWDAIAFANGMINEALERDETNVAVRERETLTRFWDFIQRLRQSNEILWGS